VQGNNLENAVEKTNPRWKQPADKTWVSAFENVRIPPMLASIEEHIHGHARPIQFVAPSVRNVVATCVQRWHGQSRNANCQTYM